MNKTCKKHGHKWGSGKFKQYCERDGCLAIKRLMENRFPKIGEAKYEWVIDEFDWEPKVGKILLDDKKDLWSRIKDWWWNKFGFNSYIRKERKRMKRDTTRSGYPFPSDID